jgi:hypothetical protein
VKWVPLTEARIDAEANSDFRKLLTERDKNPFRPIELSPKFNDYAQICPERQSTSGKLAYSQWMQPMIRSVNVMRASASAGWVRPSWA